MEARRGGLGHQKQKEDISAARYVEDAGKLVEVNGRQMKQVVLTTEYDVFGCDAFLEDKGRWLRLMPDADYIPP